MIDRFWIVSLFAIMTFILPAAAQDPAGRSSARPFTVLTGNISAKSQGDLELVRSLTDLLSSRGSRLIPMIGSSPMDNADDLITDPKADLAVMQSDLPLYLKRFKNTNPISRLEYLVRLKPQIVYLIAPESIASVRQLAGKTIAVVDRGNHEETSARTIFSLLGIQAEFVQGGLESGIQRVQAGQAAAMLIIDEPGAAAVQDVPGSLKLLDIPYNNLLAEYYAQSTLRADTYAALVKSRKDVNTIEFSKVLAISRWPADHPQHKRLAEFTSALLPSISQANLDQLRLSEITSPVTGWKRFGPAETWLDQNKVIPVASTAMAPLRTAFNDWFQKSLGATGSDMNEKQKATLFESFLRWKTLPAVATINVHLTSVSGLGRFIGTITAENTTIRIGNREEEALKLRTNLTGLTPGVHALHLHENPNCGPGEKDGKLLAGLGAGGHLFAEAVAEGGQKTVYRSHLGDMPDVTVSKDGTSVEEIIVPRLTLGDLLNRSIMIHATAEDYSPREACGVIN